METDAIITAIETAESHAARKAWAYVLYQRGIIEGLRIGANAATGGAARAERMEGELIQDARAKTPKVVLS